jgi:hypothetical protein
MRSERADFIAVHSLPGIDYVDSHLYLQNGQPGVSLTRLHDFLDDRAQLARFVVKKPLVIGEFGFRTDQGPQYRGLPRARWFAELLGRHFQNQGAGALAWIYEPFHGKPRDFGIYIDRPFTDDVRQVLRDFGGRVLRGEPFAPNPRLSPQQGVEPLYPVEQVLYGSPRPLGQWQRAVTGSLHLPLPPPSFRVARFARLGVWDGKPAVHFYGAESGEVEFRFLSPPPALRPPALAEIELAARLSAEWPGASAPADGGTLLAGRAGRRSARGAADHDRRWPGHVVSLPQPRPAAPRQAAPWRAHPAPGRARRPQSQRPVPVRRRPRPRPAQVRLRPPASHPPSHDPARQSLIERQTSLRSSPPATGRRPGRLQSSPATSKKAAGMIQIMVRHKQEGGRDDPDHGPPQAGTCQVMIQPLIGHNREGGGCGWGLVDPRSSRSEDLTVAWRAAFRQSP